MTRLIGVVDQSITVIARSTAGAAVTGKVAADFTIYYKRDAGGALTLVAASNLASGTAAHSDGGVFALSDTNAPGAYRVDLPDAACAAGATLLTVYVQIAGAMMAALEIELVPQVNVTVAGSLDANVTHAAGTAWLSGAIPAAAIGTAAITAAKFAAGAIDAAAIATDAIGSAELNATAVTKIAAGILSDSTPFDGANIPSTLIAVNAIKAKTDALPTDPADQSLIIAATDAILAILGTPAGVSLAADIATRLASASYTTPPTTAENADALLARSIVGGANGGRDVKGALKRLRNRTRTNAGMFEVYEANDTDIAWSGPVTTAAGNPVTEVNPT